MTGRLVRLLVALAVGAGLSGLPVLAIAQDSAPKPEQRDDIPPPLVKPQVTGPANAATGSVSETRSAPVMAGEGTDGKGPDFDAWDAMATRAEQALSTTNTTDVSLNLLRAQLTDWRPSSLRR